MSPRGNSEAPSINADCACIAFDSDANINNGNPDLRDEIYLFDRMTGIITQVTSDPDEDSREPSVNADCTLIAFRSDADIDDNPENNSEIYIFDTVAGTFTQITFTTSGTSRDPSINASGTRVAFQSTANINNGNADTNDEIYLFDTTTGIFTQITFTTSGTSEEPSISADGTRVAFSSNANINGGNPDGNREMYFYDTTTGIITQITDEPDGNSDDAAISGDGMRIGFDSRANINGGNPEGNEEVYIFDIITGIITQLTDEPTGDSEDPALSADGTYIAFESEADINGGNTDDDNEEVYLATCFDPATARNIPTLSEWGLIAMAGVLGIIGFFAVRRTMARA